jgi:hypothetical protein
MPRRTALDTLFDNERTNTPTNDEEMLGLGEVSTMLSDDARAVLARAQANGSAVVGFPMDPEDDDQFNEGIAGSDEEDDLPDAITDEEYQTLVASGIEAAENYIDTELSPDRELAAKYYRGDKFGNEEENRSQVVMTSVRDTVLSLMPALLRVFCGTTDAVEFINNEGTPVEQAKEQTAYINHIIHKDNNGFITFHSGFKDALVRRTGIFTWWHEEKEIAVTEVMTGLNEEAFALLQLEESEASEDSEYIKYHIQVTDERPDTTAKNETPQMLGDEDLSAPSEENLIRDVEVTRVYIKKRHRVTAVPPEEFIVTPVASDDLDEFPLVGRRQMKTIGEIVALGHDEALVRELIGSGGTASSLQMNPEAIDRNNAVVERLFDNGFSQVDPASEYVKYCTVYILVDKDGDGILERRKVITVGPHNRILYDARVGEMVPFALLCPDPEPHSPFGYSIADQTMDMQEIQSEIVRGILDSLAESIVGRTAIVENKVNIDDALSNDRDQLIRVKEQGAIWSLSRPFNGQNALPVLEYLDNIKARRTGVTMAPSGLSPDVLQSTSTAAVESVVDASQERAEMIARIFAETGMKRLFRGLLQQVVKHQDKKRQIRLRGKAVTVDPRSFVADLDLETNVGLGRGNAAKRIGALMFVLAQQKEVFTLYGPGNDLVGLDHISNCLEDLVREQGFNDVSRYMNVIDKATADKKRQEAQAAAAQQQKPSPEEIMAQSNTENNQTKLAIAEQAEATKRMKSALDDDRARDKAEQDFYTKAAELLGKFGVQANEAEMRARMEEDKATEGMANNAQAGAQALLPPPGPAPASQGPQ